MTEGQMMAQISEAVHETFEQLQGDVTDALSNEVIMAVEQASQQYPHVHNDVEYSGWAEAVAAELAARVQTMKVDTDDNGVLSFEYGFPAGLSSEVQDIMKVLTKGNGDERTKPGEMVYGNDLQAGKEPSKAVRSTPIPPSWQNGKIDDLDNLLKNAATIAFGPAPYDKAKEAVKDAIKAVLPKITDSMISFS